MTVNDAIDVKVEAYKACIVLLESLEALDLYKGSSNELANRISDACQNVLKDKEVNKNADLPQLSIVAAEAVVKVCSDGSLPYAGDPKRLGSYVGAKIGHALALALTNKACTR